MGQTVSVDLQTQMQTFQSLVAHKNLLQLKRLKELKYLMVGIVPQVQKSLEEHALFKPKMVLLLFLQLQRDTDSKELLPVLRNGAPKIHSSLDQSFEIEFKKASLKNITK